MRSIDVVARLGGEEFGLILPGADGFRAADLALYRAKDLGRDRSVRYDSGWDPASEGFSSRAESETK